MIKDKNICEVSIFTLGLSDFYNRYKSPDDERSIMKNIPNTEENIKWANRIVPSARIAWRGTSTDTYSRPQSFCHKNMGKSFAIYRRNKNDI